MKIITILVFLLSFTDSCLYAQIIGGPRGAGLLTRNETLPKEYVIIRDTSLINENTGLLYEGVIIKSGTIIKPLIWNSISLESLRINDRVKAKDPITQSYINGNLVIMDYKSPTGNGYISSDDIAIFGSACLPEPIVYAFNKVADFYWIPSYSIDIIQTENRETIFNYEKGRPNSGYDIGGNILWHDMVPEPIRFFINNTRFGIISLSSSSFVNIQSIKYSEPYYEIISAIHKKEFQTNELNPISENIFHLDNIPNLHGSNPAVLLLEISENNNRMRVYNGETKRIILDLVKVPLDFYDNYIQFIRTNEVPRNMMITEEFTTGWPGNIKIAPPYKGERLYYTTTSNLRVRSAPDTNGEIIGTIHQGGKVLPLEHGLSATIDGIRAPWVWVRTADGKEGWCFSGYLSSIANRR